MRWKKLRNVTGCMSCVKWVVELSQSESGVTDSRLRCYRKPFMHLFLLIKVEAWKTKTCKNNFFTVKQWNHSLKPSFYYALQQQEWTVEDISMANDEIRAVVMGTMLSQMSLKMLLTLTDKMYFTVEWYQMWDGSERGGGFSTRVHEWSTHRCYFVLSAFFWPTFVFAPLWGHMVCVRMIREWIHVWCGGAVTAHKSRRWISSLCFWCCRHRETHICNLKIIFYEKKRRIW